MNTLKQIREIANRAKMGDDAVEFVFQLNDREPKWDYPDLLMDEMEGIDD